MLVGAVSYYNPSMDPKEILGVDSDATQQEIQEAYLEKAKKHHPDVGGDNRAFQLVQDAYEALTNPKPTTPNHPVDRHADSERTSQTIDSKKQVKEHNWKNLFLGQLPLQTETTTFILINCLDIFMTYALLQTTSGAVEANPIADYFLQRWNIYGLIGFKLAIVAFVTVIAQIVAIKKPKTARCLLITGSVLVGCVVLYIIALFIKHLA